MAEIIRNQRTFDFEMERNHRSNVNFRLLITEETDLVNKTTRLTAAVQCCNTSGEIIRDYDYKLLIKINGSTLVDEKYYNRSLSSSGNYETMQHTTLVIYHDENGNATASVYAEIKADEMLILSVYQTKGSASFSGALTSIDLSLPFVRDISVSANRYGLNAGVNMTVGHTSYKLLSVVFVLKGLTREQATARYGKVTEANVSNYVQESDGTYTLTLAKTSGLLTLNEIFFDLDGKDESSNPLSSGTSYQYYVTLRAATDVSFTFNGSFYVPQKVTGISSESLIELKNGVTRQLEYQIVPYNSEEQSVVFSSSNESVATVDDQGKITAVGDGVCVITIKTVDGGFTASCTINVFDKERFPQLSNVEILSENAVNKIRSAILFLFSQLTDKGVNVPTLPLILYDGKSHPVKEIRNVLETIESCCQILKTASNTVYPCSALPNEQYFLKNNTDGQWYFVVNEWINFLNELNEKITKEA